MQIPRVYIPALLTAGKRLELTRQAARHVVTVLRLKPGAPLVIFDGQGSAHQATLEDSTQVVIGQRLNDETESPLQIHLIQAISRGERMDHVIQKAVELGVCKITPVLTRRCMVKLKGERAVKRLQHWQGIAISACEQCGRNQLPVLNAITTFDTALSEPGNNLKLVLDPTGQNTLSNLAPPGDRVTLLIGPEGGLTGEEIQQAHQSGFVRLRMGPRVLRTESAAVAALSALQTLWGDLG